MSQQALKIYSNLIGHFGRGFYALSPSFYNEFYRANDFEILKMAYLMRGGSGRWIEMPIGKHYLQYADMNRMIWGDSGTVKTGVPCDSSLLLVLIPPISVCPAISTANSGFLSSKS